MGPVGWVLTSGCILDLRSDNLGYSANNLFVVRHIVATTRRTVQTAEGKHVRSNGRKSTTQYRTWSVVAELKAHIHATQSAQAS
jgi:hypothetical protein